MYKTTGKSTSDYVQTVNIGGYLNNREITNLNSNFLVKGSHDAVIVNKEKVASRLGYTLLGAAKTKNAGHRSSYDWETSSNVTRSLRMNSAGELEVWYKQAWHNVHTYAAGVRANFTSCWSTTELLDLLLFAVGTDEIQMWSGGMAEIASATATTLTLKGYYSAATIAMASPITITDSANGFLTSFFAAGDKIEVVDEVTYTASTISFNADLITINDSANGFVTAGFRPGDRIRIVGTTLNNGGGDEFIVDTVAAGAIKLTSSYLHAEGAGSPVTLTGTSPNDGFYTIATVVAGQITLTADATLTTEAVGRTIKIKKPGATWGESRFLSHNPAGTVRSVTINGSRFFYTGGETTGTLTGVTPTAAAIVAGDVAIQTVVGTRPTALRGINIDLISSAPKDNYVFYGSLTSRQVNMSKSTDYTDFTTASVPRQPGEACTFSLDSVPTAFVPSAGTADFYISGRKSDWYKISFSLSSDNSGEAVTIDKLPTSTNQGAATQGSVISSKNGVVFLNFDQTIDTLQRLLATTTPQSFPISWDIKNDLLTYDLTDAQGIFYQNQSFFCLPAEGKVLIYDHYMQHWQPPHNLPVGRLALIDVNEDGTQVLCGHAESSNETYRLYDGYTDNGAPMKVEMWFGYENYGTRFSTKVFDEIATEIYASENTNVTNYAVYDYKGATDIRTFLIRGDDTVTRFKPVDSAGLGFNPLGSQPLGSLATGIEDLSKFRTVDTTSVKDFFERQRGFVAEGKDIRFAVLAYGENTEISENIPQYLKR